MKKIKQIFIKHKIMYKDLLGDESMKKLNKIEDKMELLEKIYDHIRIIDFANNEILELKEGELVHTDTQCHECLSKEECEECILRRTWQEEETIIEMEYEGEKMFMITAVPIYIKEKKVVVELMKETTNELYLKDRKSGTRMKLFSKIDLMNKLAVMDELTNLYNRRFIYEQLPKNLLEASSNKEHLSIIFTDLDYFKDINDKYGHIAGDEVLRRFAKILQTNIRKDRDWVARFGGEEFIITLPNTNLEEARFIAEKIRKSVMEEEIIIDNQKIQITASFGVYTVCDGNKCTTANSLIKMVDEKLYKAKIRGRNTVV